MGLGSLLRTSARWGIGAGVVAMYYQSGLWKSAEETIANYENIKNEVDGFISSAPPVMTDVITDVSNYGANLTAPATKAVSDFQRDWLSFDLSWMRNKDGILKPAWNNLIAISCDFLAHSPQTLKELTARGYTKASEYMNSAPISHHTTATVSPASSSSPGPQQKETPRESSSIKQ